MSTANAVLAALTGYGLKQEGEGRYRLNSPFRPGSNSHAFSLVIENDEHGAWKDHVSEQSGSLYELAKHLGVETPRANVASTKRKYAGIADYAKAHGVTVEIMSRPPWMWREVKRQNRLALEYMTPTGRRWRFLDGEAPYYKSETGYKRCWYGLSQEILDSVGDDLPLVICNGEPGVLVAQTWGIPAICMTGGENSTIPPHLIEELKGVNSPIIIALDCDGKGILAANGIAAQLTAAGHNARAIDLGLSDKGDLGDFCVLYGSDAHKRIHECAPLVPSKQSSLTTQSTRDYGVPADKIIGQGRRFIVLKTDDLSYVPPVRWLLQPYIVEGGSNVIYGPSGSGKSFLAVWLALQIAQTAPVLYLAYEGERGYDSRVRACQKHYGYQRGFHIALGNVRLMDDDDFSSLIDVAQQIKPACIFIDTLARSMGGDLDENMARDIGKYLDRIDELRAMLNCATVIIHHTGKNGTERGSSALRGTLDSMIEVSPRDEFIEVSASKSKDFADNAFDLFSLKEADTGLKNDEGFSVFAPVFVKADGTPNVLRDMTKNQRKVLEIMNGEVYKYGARYTDLAAETSLSSKTLTDVLTALLKREYIQQEARNEPYAITAAGRAAVIAGKPWQSPIEIDETTTAPLASAKKSTLPGMGKGSAYHNAGM